MNAVKKLITSFVYAFRGLGYCIKTCRNFRIHTVAAVFVLWLSRFYDFDKTTYAVVLTVIAIVISLEAMNTALEEACDTEISEKIKHAKDAAAASVLCASIFAVAAAAFLYVDINAFNRIFAFFAETPLNLLFFGVAVAVAAVYIFYEDIFKHGKQ